MAWAEVSGSKAVTTNDAGATSVAATMGASVPSGALMWAAVKYAGAAAGHITSITGGGTWSMVGSEVQLVGPDEWLSLWKAVATSTAAHTVTVNFDNSRSMRTLYIGAWTGNDAAGATDGSNGEADASTTAPSVTFATAVDGDLLIGITMNSYPNAGTAGSGFNTATSSGGSRPITQETKVQTTASGSTVVDFSGSNSATWVTIAAAFKASATATLEQEGFRWVQDDGSESASTFTAAQDTNITAAAGTTKRLRVLVNATGDPATKQYKLQWRLSGGSWADVT